MCVGVAIYALLLFVCIAVVRVGMSDFKELIPEFFEPPGDFLVNLNVRIYVCHVWLCMCDYVCAFVPDFV